jgi:hypothetical protein
MTDMNIFVSGTETASRALSATRMDGLSECRTLQPHEMRDYWRVAASADLTEALPEHRANASVRGVGVAPKNGWASALAGCDTPDTQSVVDARTAEAACGYIEHGDLPRALVTGRTRIRMPRDNEDVRRILGGFREIDPKGAAWLRVAIDASLHDDDTVCLVAEDPLTAVATGVFCFRRELTVVRDRATLDVFVRGFHCEGTLNDRAALLACFLKQTVVDIETSYLSLVHAGIDIRLGPTVHAEANDIGMFGTFVTIVERAMAEAFDDMAGPVPAWCDMGAWVDNVVSRKGAKVSRAYGFHP